MPDAQLSTWLTCGKSPQQTATYEHFQVTEDASARTIGVEGLKAYVRHAHEDARRRLRRLAERSLDPLEPLPRDPAEGYPERCHFNSLKGYFGEVFAAIVASNFAPFGESGWQIPAFLFRFHFTEFHQLEEVRQTGGRVRTRTGRLGDDCLAFVRNSEGQITGSLVCEAKCTADHDSGMIADAHAKASSRNQVPVDVPNLIEVLSDYDDPESIAWANALAQLWLKPPSSGYERFDLVSYVHGRGPKRGTCWIRPTKPHDKYTGARKLAAFEIRLENVEALIREVYQTS